MNRHVWMVLLAAASGLFAVAAARAEEPLPLDAGRFIVYEAGKPVAHEDFEYFQFSDSMVVYAKAERKIRRADGTDVTFSKTMGLIADLLDFNLRRYASTQSMGADTTRRGIVPDDTVMTVLVESPVGGEAERMVRPPGRLYVLDSQVWTLIDVIGRNLHRQTFEVRPVAMMAFGNPPGTIEATARRMAPDTLRWGGKRVVTDRLELKDGNARFLLWMSPQGRMLKMEVPESKVMVLREAPPVPAASRRRPR